MTTPLGAPFRRLIASSATSNLADGIGKVAFPLLAASLTRDPVAVAALSALVIAPWLLFAIPAGALVDRTDRRRAMAAANLLRAVVIGAVAVLVVTGQITVPLLYVAAFAVGTAETVYDSAARAMLPQVVRRDQLERGNGLLTVEETVGQTFAGAPLGAALFAGLAFLPFATNAVGFLLAAVLILTVSGRFRPERTVRTTVRHDIGEGLRWLWHHPLLRNLMLVMGATGTLLAMGNAVFVLYALEVLGTSETGFGLLLTAGGIGGVIGALLAAPLGRWLGRVPAMVVASLVNPFAYFSLGLTSDVVLAGVVFGVAAASMSVWNVLTMSLRQALIPEELFGRVIGAYRTVIWGGIPVGSLLGGVLADATSLPTVFMVAGALQLLTAFVVAWIFHRQRDVVTAAYAEDTDLATDSAGDAVAVEGKDASIRA